MAVLVGLPFVALALRRLAALLVTVPALALAAPISRRLTRRVYRTDLRGREFLAADGAPASFITRRREGLDALASALYDRSTFDGDEARALRDGLSDLRFTDASRVPFPFAREMRERFSLSSIVTASRGPRLRQLDGRWTLDVSGSYGLNVAGFDQVQDVDRARLGPRA